MATGNAPHPELLDQVRDRLRVKHCNLRTEDKYLQWIRRFILFHDKRHPREMGAAEVMAFLTHLAVQGKVVASTQNQALSALLFLYRKCWALTCPGCRRSFVPSRCGVCRWCCRGRRWRCCWPRCPGCMG